MRRLLLGLGMVAGLIGLLGACVQVEQNRLELGVAETSKQPVGPEPELVDTSRWIQSASEVEVETCQIPDGRPSEMSTLRPGNFSLGSYGMSNVGFPLSPDLLPITGAANIVVVPVAFSDLAGSPAEVDVYLEDQTQQITKWSEFVSQAAFRYEFQVVKDWVVLEGSAADYEIRDVPGGNRDVATYIRLAEDIASSVGAKANWAIADGLLVLFPRDIATIGNDWGGRGDLVRTPEGEKPLFFWGGGLWHFSDPSYKDYLWSFWIHELLHSQGLNLHAPGNGWATGLGQNQYPNGGKFSGLISAWESFLLGWISSEQILCVDAREGIGEHHSVLTPLEVYGGEKKAIIVRTGAHEGIVVEARRPIGYTRWQAEDEGLLVYRLDTSLMNDRSGERNGRDCGNSPEFDKWAYYLEPSGGSSSSCDFSDYLLSEGQSVVSSGVKIEAVGQTHELSYVRVSRSTAAE